MTEKANDKKSLASRLSESYKLVLYRDEDFKEISSYNLSMGSVYIGLSIFFLLLAGAIVSLILFTPIKTLIPGYGDIQANPQFIKLVEDVNTMVQERKEQETYIQALQNILGIEEIDSNVSEGLEYLVPTNANGLNNDQVGSLYSIENARSELSQEIDIIQTLQQKQVVRPVDGLISSDFDPTIKHYGIDILAPAESPIKAMMDGFVFLSGWDVETGYTIGIQHEGNILSFYKHNSIILKEKGTFVRSGEAVAIIGNTGTLSSGPHLHFELWHNGKPVNPNNYINFN